MAPGANVSPMGPGARRWLVVAVALAAALAGCSAAVPFVGEDDGLSVRWTSDTGTTVEGNHHAIAAGRVDGEAVVLVPLGGSPGGHGHAGQGVTPHAHAGCELVALDGAGDVRWRKGVAAGNCTIHAVADPTLADATGDGRPEALAASTDRELVAYAPLSGDRLYGVGLTGYGYAKPVVADVVGDDRPEMVALDVRGTATLVGADGEPRWRRPLGAISWAPPAVLSTADGTTRVVVGLGDGRVVGLGPGGSVAWNRSVAGGVTWATTGDVDGDGRREYVGSTFDGGVVALDADGQVLWRRALGRLAAVGGVADGDGDGDAEVYVTDRAGHLRALAGATGATEWNRSLTRGSPQMTPPPSVGDLDGDGDPELVAATNAGEVTVRAPANGTVLATYDRDALLYTHATLSDTDGDGAAEMFVPYGDGRAVSLSYRSSSASS